MAGYGLCLALTVPPARADGIGGNATGPSGALVLLDPAALAPLRKRGDVLTYRPARGGARAEIRIDPSAGQAMGPGYARALPDPQPSGAMAGPFLGATRSLSFEAAVRKAVAWHPSVDEAVNRLNESKTQIDVAKSGYRPQISGGLNTGIDILNGARWQPRAQASLSQMVHDFGKTASAVDAARAGTQVSRAQLLQAVDTLIRNTVYAVIETQRYHALLIVAQKQLASIARIDALVRLRTQKGASTRSDAVQAEARVQGAQAAIMDITGQLDRWRSNLAFLTGADGPVDTLTDVPDWFDQSCAPVEPDWMEVPAILQMQARREEAAATLRGANANRLPSISVGADMLSNLRDPVARDSEMIVGLRLSSSIFDGGANRARRAAADYAVRSADAALGSARNEVGRSLQESREQISAYRSQLDILSSREGMMEETGKLYSLQYLQMGTRTLLDLLNAQQELYQVQFDYANARHDIRRLNADCLFSSGRTREAFVLSGTTLRGVTL